ncbi:GAP family protein [Nocardioides sp. GXQ0305]|uniref:GAP family protein n=1 Tax=Nocardioides sp. GXQ0305 TaxID=3423912 RepID=UPI003D7D6785
MNEAIGQSLPIAVGVMVSPLPIVAVVLMLVSGSARANAVAFVLTWFVAVGGVALVVALAAGTADDDGAPASWTGWVKIVLGALLLLLAVRRWQGRPRDGAQAPTPTWMAAVDTFTPVKAVGLAALLGAVNPKNLLLAVSGGAAIATAAPGDVRAAVGASVVFAVVASLGVAAPVVVYLATGDRATGILDDLKGWMVAHNAAIMAVLLLVIGTKLVGDGLTVV